MRFVIISEKYSYGTDVINCEETLSTKPALTHVTHFSFIAGVLAETDKIVPGLDASAFMFTRVWSTSAKTEEVA